MLVPKPFSLQKKSLSLYIRTGCERQCRLSLYSTQNRRDLHMAPKQEMRAGLGGVGAAGDDYQDQVVSQVETVFGSANVLCSPHKQPGKNRPQTLDLQAHIRTLRVHQFVVESKFSPPPRFLQILGVNALRDSDDLLLELSDLNPDIILVSPARRDSERAGTHAVEADGTLTRLAEDDARLQLRVIDVKLASEPGAHYFAEVVYYSMALAAWLEEQDLTDRFVVAANGAVWPGSYETSALQQRYAEGIRSGLPAPIEELIAAMEADLETAEFTVYGPHVRRFFEKDLPRIIGKPWQELEWHANFRCGGCDFLGYDWNIPGKAPDPLHCWPTAATSDHLSRIYGLTKGAAALLRQAAPTVHAVAQLTPDHAIFKMHPTLRAKKDIILARADALVNNRAGGIKQSGASAIIPSWADLKLFVTLDYDPSSAITVALSLRASWREPAPYGAERERAEKRWGDKTNGYLVHIVDRQDIEDEKREFLGFLKTIKNIMGEVRELDEARLAAGEQRALQSGTGEKNAEKRSTYQIYLWDNAQFRHLTRLVSRHLPAILDDPDLRNLAWLFPPDELLPDPDNATRHSPISLVGEAVENHLAVPVPHYYSLYEVAQSYLAPPPGKILDLYRDPLTNLIPPERIHELWKRHDDWKTTMRRIEETSALKTLALSMLTDKLSKDPDVHLSKSIAPVLAKPPGASRLLNPIKATPEAILWFEFAKLNAALAEVETQMYYALPPAEREARFGSAHLTRRLSGQDAADALQLINASCNTSLLPAHDLWVYILSPLSRDVKIKAGDFTWALSPRDENLFLNRSALHGDPPRLPNAPLYADTWGQSIGDAGLTQVSLEAIDRQNRLVALRANRKNRIAKMEEHGDADFCRDVMLDPTALDILSKKVKQSLEGIGQPQHAPPNPTVLAALRHPHIKPSGKKVKQVEAHAFLYDPAKLAAQSVARATADLAARLKAEKLLLNTSQWQAWQTALTRRLTLIWGPPGTGKSETLRAIVRGAVLDAQLQNKPLRLLVTANNYNAVDNVLLELETHLRQSNAAAKLYRLERKGRSENEKWVEHPNLINIGVDRHDPDAPTLDFLQLLNAPGTEIIIAGTVPHQLHNLAFINDSGINAPVKEWFDFVVLDEASQMDVASSTIVFSKIAPGGACVLAGDDKQLPPIQQAQAPTGLEWLVGSAYSFMKEHHGIEPCALNVNYRSNRTIVDFTIEAGYKPSLTAHSLDLKLNLTKALPVSAPATWPMQLPFSSDWGRLLDPAKPLTCFLYDDTVSGQSNAFEAQAVAALIHLLQNNMGAPLHRRNHEGVEVAVKNAAYSRDDFWKKGVGVVAPHRAQGSRITDLLRRIFPPAGGTPSSLIAGAVDTVERYQGQQRDVIIASFGLGDPEVIANEDEFLYDLRRFNVMVSRACTKVVVLMTRSVLEHLSNDQDVLRDSGLLKRFAELYCRDEAPLELPYFDDENQWQTRSGVMRTA